MGSLHICTLGATRKRWTLTVAHGQDDTTHHRIRWIQAVPKKHVTRIVCHYFTNSYMADLIVQVLVSTTISHAIYYEMWCVFILKYVYVWTNEVYSVNRELPVSSPLNCFHFWYCFIWYGRELVWKQNAVYAAFHGFMSRVNGYNLP